MPVWISITSTIGGMNSVKPSLELFSDTFTFNAISDWISNCSIKKWFCNVCGAIAFKVSNTENVSKPNTFREFNVIEASTIEVLPPIFISGIASIGISTILFSSSKFARINTFTPRSFPSSSLFGPNGSDTIDPSAFSESFARLLNRLSVWKSIISMFVGTIIFFCADSGSTSFILISFR